MILYGLAQYYKNKLIKRINDSIYYSVLFYEALNFCYTKVSDGCQHSILGYY